MALAYVQLMKLVLAQKMDGGTAILLRNISFGLTLTSLGVALACSGTDDGNNSGGDGGNSAASGSGGSGALSMIDAGPGDSGLDPDSACAAHSAEASLVDKPVDILFVIDNSGSMSNENAAVQANINQNFASIIGASGIDYRVIMLTSYSSGYKVQVGPPLGGGTGGSVPHNNPPIFFHYNRQIGSHNAWCALFDSYETPDVHGFSGGWKDWLRADAFKIIVVITDDSVACTSKRTGNTYSDGNNATAGVTAGDQFDADLLALSPAHFGSASSRNYVLHSILGMAASSDPSKAHFPADPISVAKCSTGINPGTGYQHVSMLTGGLRFPVCEGSGFDAVFQKIAEGVILGAKLACEVAIPTDSAGKEIDLDTIQVEYTAGGGGPTNVLEQVAGASACKPNAFYIEADLLKLCPDSCTTIQADDAAKLSVLYGCKPGVPS
jgi:hypothetical protein